MKGKCRICRSHKFVEDMHCHHSHPRFPLEQINKVNNLAWPCKECHWMVHGKEIPEKLDNIMVQKINQFRKKLETIYNEQ